MITSFHVQNYKALRDVKLDLTPIHVLIGPNDSGKTSILEALAALCRSVDCEPKRMETAFVGRWIGRELVWQGSIDQPTIQLGAEVEVDQEQYTLQSSFAFDTTDKRQVTFRSEQLGLPDGSRYTIRSEGGGRDSLGDDIDPGGLPARKATPAIRKAMHGVHTYRFEPRDLRLPVAPDSSRKFRMEPSGFGLARCLDDILSYDRDRFTALETRFRSIFPHVKSLKLMQEPAYKAPVDNDSQVLMLQRSDGKGLHFQFTGNAELVPAAQVSDGLLLVLAYLAVLYLPEPPRVLLVEEPENGVHPARLAEVLTILRDLITEQDQTQIILTTHSPYVVDLFQPYEVTLCSKGADGAVKVRRLSESRTVREQMNVFTLGEIWIGEGDEELLKKAPEEAAAGSAR